MRWRTPTSLPPRAFSRSIRATWLGAGQRQPADDAAHEVDLLAEIETFLGLAADLMQHLDQHRSLDASARELGAQIVRGEIARKAVTHQVGPGIGVPA